jgi:hypothetical protein
MKHLFYDPASLLFVDLIYLTSIGLSSTSEPKLSLRYFLSFSSSSFDFASSELIDGFIQTSILYRIFCLGLLLSINLIPLIYGNLHIIMINLTLLTYLEAGIDSPISKRTNLSQDSSI